MKRLVSVSFAFLTLLLFCCKENSVVPPPDPPGKQKHIFWPSLADSPWPVFHGDPQSTGRSKYKGPQLGVIDWSYTFTGRAKFSFVNIDVGNIIRLTCGWSRYDPALLSLSSQGVELWKINLTDSSRAGLPEILHSATIDAYGTIYVGASNGYFYAINPDGSIKWKYNTVETVLSGLAGANIGLDGTIYFSTNTTLFALNRDGILQWKLNNVSPVEFKSSPSFTFSRDGKTIYVGGNKGLFALDQSGNLKWQFEFRNSYGLLFPLVDSDENIYFLTDSNFYSVNASGVLRWKYSLPLGEYMDPTTAPTMDSNGNLYYTGDGKLYSLDYEGTLRWAAEGIKSGGSHLVCDSEGTIYVSGTSGGSIYAVTIEGKKKWELQVGTDQQIVCGPALSSDGRLYILSYASGFLSTLYVIK